MATIAMLTDSIIEDLIAVENPDEPCGPNLEYDPQFLAFETAVKGKPEDQIGSVVREAVPPNWKELINDGVALIQRSRDLRVAIELTRGMMELRGLFGLRLGLHLVAELLSHHWEHVYPQLDREENNDPTMRINVISSLNSNDNFLREVRELPLTVTRAHGIYSIRSVDLATGALEPGKDEELPSISLIEANFKEEGLDDIDGIGRMCRLSVQAAERIESIVMEKAGAMHALDMSPLLTLLRKIRDYVGQQHANRTGVTLDENGTAVVEASGASGEGGSPLTGDIRNRGDVKRALDKAINYFNQFEPSSPVPILLERAQKLVDMSFMEILEDLTPDGVDQAKVIAGTLRR